MPPKPGLRSLIEAKAIRESVVANRPFPRWRDAKCLLDELISKDSETCPILVAGSTSFDFPAGTAMEDACQYIGTMLREVPGIALITGGMPGVGVSVGKAFASPTSLLFHVLPERCRIADPAEGLTMHLGHSFPERQSILGMATRIVCLIGGGPGSVREANTVFATGGFVLPVGCSGGAAAGIAYEAGDPIEESVDLAAAEIRAVSCGLLASSEWQCLASATSEVQDAANVVLTAVKRALK